MTIVPSPLLPGDKIAIVAPAGNLSNRKKFYDACVIIEQMGFVIENSTKKWPGILFLADSDKNRLQELHNAWKNPEIKGIIALRGGYGTLRLIELLNRQLIRENPKMFLGFSDISVLLNHIAQETGLICLHGPVASTLCRSDHETLDRLFDCLSGNWRAPLTETVTVIRGKKTVHGKLVGGNLSSLVTLLGSRWEIDLRGTILLLEDINEPWYRLDRLLTQLALTGKLQQVSGFILGDFSIDHSQGKEEKHRTQEFFWNRLVELVPDEDIPVWGNFPSGHCCRNITLPIGAFCTMDSIKKTLLFDESDKAIDEISR